MGLWRQCAEENGKAKVQHRVKEISIWAFAMAQKVKRKVFPVERDFCFFSCYNFHIY